MVEGWIKLHRKFLNWEWYKKPNMVHLFLHLLIKANHEDLRWQGIELKRGQLITGRNSLSKDTGISVRSIRTCIERLKSTNEITIKSTNKYTIITICNYDLYQINQINTTSKSTNKLANNRPATDQQPTTNKNIKNIKNIKYKDILYKKIIPLFDLKPNEGNQVERWIDCLRLLIELDKFDLDSIIDIIKFIRSDNFWKSNFQSFLKLRDKDKYGIKYIVKFKELKDANKKRLTSTSIEQRIQADNKKEFNKKW